MDRIEALARRIDTEAALEAEREEARRSAEEKLAAAERNAQSAANERLSVIARRSSFERECQELGFDEQVSISQIESGLAELRATIEAVQHDLQILETLQV